MFIALAPGVIQSTDAPHSQVLKKLLYYLLMLHYNLNLALQLKSA